VNSALRNTPPFNRITRNKSDSASITVSCSGVFGSGVLGKTSGVRVIRALTPPDYISPQDGSQIGCDLGCVETSQ